MLRVANASGEGKSFMRANQKSNVEVTKTTSVIANASAAFARILFGSFVFGSLRFAINLKIKNDITATNTKK